ncbi:MAG TPA: sugar ABC transporter permease [Planctomycetota bacterium]|nr:sugar ABC transporter permease [Planctomycetota bacterium]HRR79862.1 sugar ABC transporter permease [Planctomycetota bacterium]HRT92938.1 sugar ABC transporter permease [Planctomycetota bacterium]
MATESSEARRRRRRENFTGWLYVSPAALLLGLFSIFPVGYAFYVSLHDWRLVKGDFVGFGNYAEALGSDPSFGRALLATVYYVLGTVPLGLILALVLANLLMGRIRGKGVYRTIYFLPYVTSVVAAAAVWLWMLYPAPAEWGLANAMMKGLGLPAQSWVEESSGVFRLVAEHFGVSLPGWAAGPSLSLVCVMAFSIWQALGFEIVVLLAALTNVPKEIYEAAAVDGATGWRRLRHITIPLISPTLFFLSIVSTIRAFRVFNQVYIMASKDTSGTADTVTVYIFKTFYVGGRVGYGSATALLLFLIILAVTLVQMRALGARVHY